MDQQLYQGYLNILKEELVPAMGCTEPIALAYASAKAAELLGERPRRVSACVSGSIIKNVKSVIVPNTGGLKGIAASIAAGASAGKADRLLEVISDVTPEGLAATRRFLDEVPVEVESAKGGCTFDITLTFFGNRDTVKIRVANYHTNIVYLEKNGEILYSKPVIGEEEDGLTDRNILSMEGIWEFVNVLDPGDVKELLDSQIRCNTAIAEEGLRHAYGASVGRVIRTIYGNDIKFRAVASAAAGSDARMNGCELPVVINSGSGNQGITASLPVIEYAREFNISDELLYRALALSNLTTIHQKTRIGRLSAFCGAVSAGAGAGAGIAYICTGSYDAVIHTVVNTLAIISGMVCDGAKASCAGKIAAAVEAAILGFHMYEQGEQFYGGDGIVKKGIEETIDSVGKLARDGMKETNEEIIHIMIDEDRDSTGCGRQRAEAKHL